VRGRKVRTRRGRGGGATPALRLPSSTSPTSSSHPPWPHGTPPASPEAPPAGSRGSRSRTRRTQPGASRGRQEQRWPRAAVEGACSPLSRVPPQGVHHRRSLPFTPTCPEHGPTTREVTTEPSRCPNMATPPGKSPLSPPGVPYSTPVSATQARTPFSPPGGPVPLGMEKGKDGRQQAGSPSGAGGGEGEDPSFLSPEARQTRTAANSGVSAEGGVLRQQGGSPGDKWGRGASGANRMTSSTCRLPAITKGSPSPPRLLSPLLPSI